MLYYNTIEPTTLELLRQLQNIHVYQLNEVKLDIVNYKYPWIKSPFIEDNIRLATLEDIAAM